MVEVGSWRALSGCPHRLCIQALRERLQSKEVWIIDAHEWRDAAGRSVGAYGVR